MPRRILLSSIIVAVAAAFGAYAVHVGNARNPEVSLTRETREVNVRTAYEVPASVLDSSSQSDPYGSPDALPDCDVSPQQDGDYQADLPLVPVHQKRDQAHEVEYSIEALPHLAVHRLRGAGQQDLLRFILEEDISEFGLDVDAAKSFEEAILTAAAARGIPPGVGSGVTDIVCTVSLCTFVAEPLGAFDSIRQTPEWYAMEQEGPVPGVRSMLQPTRELGPARSWVRFGIRSGGGKTQVYYYRPGIERHRELLEAVIAEP